jgi:hypothetical protein
MPAISLNFTLSMSSVEQRFTRLRKRAARIHTKLVRFENDKRVAISHRFRTWHTRLQEDAQRATQSVVDLFSDSESQEPPHAPHEPTYPSSSSPSSTSTVDAEIVDHSDSEHMDEFFEKNRDL